MISLGKKRKKEKKNTHQKIKTNFPDTVTNIIDAAWENANGSDLSPSWLGFRHWPMYETCEVESIIHNFHVKKARHMLDGLNSEYALKFT